jgi:hypothetical protein
LSVIFWLATFALLADEGKYWSAIQYEINFIKQTESEFPDDFPGGNLPDGISLGLGTSSISKIENALKCSRAAEGLSVINWILFVITLIVFGKYGCCDFLGWMLIQCARRLFTWTSSCQWRGGIWRLENFTPSGTGC